MNTRYVLIPLAAFAFMTCASAQTIWRCGNTYTNDRAEAQAKNCKAVEGGNVTVVQGTRANGGAAPAGGGGGTSLAKASTEQRRSIEASDQKARDSEARGILEAELKKAQARQADLQKEYNAGEPEMLGPEHRNRQKYIDRVAELKAALERNESDISGLTRELARSGGGSLSK
jgi:hypothetical protein